MYARDRTAVVAAIVLLLLVIGAVVGPLVITADPAQQLLSLRRSPPDREHLLGLDHLGRDILARLVHGARYTLLASGGATILISVAGLFIGVVAGYYGRWVDQILMRIVDVALAFPYFLAAIVIVAVLGPDLKNAILAVAFAKIPVYTRVVRSVVLQAREMPYTEAARSLGCGDARIMLRHIVPNVILPAIVLSTTEMASVVLALAGLSFLGLGAQPPVSEWGLMLSEAKGYVSQAPHMLLAPGIALAVLVLSINLAGDGLRFAVDPRSRR